MLDLAFDFIPIEYQDVPGNTSPPLAARGRIELGAAPSPLRGPPSNGMMSSTDPTNPFRDWTKVSLQSHAERDESSLRKAAFQLAAAESTAGCVRVADEIRAIVAKMPAAG